MFAWITYSKSNLKSNGTEIFHLSVQEQKARERWWERKKSKKTADLLYLLYKIHSILHRFWSHLQRSPLSMSWIYIVGYLTVQFAAETGSCVASSLEISLIRKFIFQSKQPPRINDTKVQGCLVPSWFWWFLAYNCFCDLISSRNQTMFLFTRTPSNTI